MFFVLPKQVLQDITKICRAVFLWSGDYSSSKAGYVNWADVCTPKSACGLGIRNIFLWNTAAIGKYVWAVEKKLDNLWVKWIHAVYIHKIHGGIMCQRVLVAGTGGRCVV